MVDIRFLLSFGLVLIKGGLPLRLRHNHLLEAVHIVDYLEISLLK